MDSLLYFLNFLRFKSPDRLGLTLRSGLFITLALTLLYLICSFNAGQWLDFNPSTFKLILRSTPELIFVAIFGGLLLLLVLLITFLYDLFRWIITPCTYSFEPEECLNNIDFQGKVVKKDKEFSMTSSGSGMLFKRYWRNFNAEFEFKFEGENGKPLKPTIDGEDNYLGFIFRARDLDNYFMLSIGVKKYKKQKEEEFLLITPHVKVGGAWDVFTGEKTLVEKVKNFRVDGDNKLILQVKGNVLKLWIEKPDKKEDQENQKGKTEEKEPLFTWHLPSHYLINWGKEKETNSYTPGDSSKIPFRNSIGRIGFRAYGDERFLIRNLTIKRLD